MAYVKKYLPLNSDIQEEWDEQEDRIETQFNVVGLIESGNNTDGSWIKFPDGTMIVYRDVEVALEDEKLKYRDFDLPQSFINSNYNIQFTNNNHGWGYEITARANSNSRFSVQVNRPNNTTNVFKGTVLCIGKWK